ncbi:MAG: cob(I)yrinic acid a,c-diamide adenosyltransferase [Candidatus Methylacidiphilales bacterium]
MSSIATRTGDDGSTALLFGRRVYKNDPRVEAYGTVDELSAALGLARATARDRWIASTLLAVQKDLVAVMGDLAVAPEDRERYNNSKLPKVQPEMLTRLDEAVEALEGKGLKFDGWATPGASLHAASLDMARTICRRAERRIAGLDRETKEILKIMNRLSDMLWLMARLEENQL